MGLEDAEGSSPAHFLGTSLNFLRLSSDFSSTFVEFVVKNMLTKSILVNNNTIMLYDDTHIYIYIHIVIVTKVFMVIRQQYYMYVQKV